MTILKELNLHILLLIIYLELSKMIAGKLFKKGIIKDPEWIWVWGVCTVLILIIIAKIL